MSLTDEQKRSLEDALHGDDPKARASYVHRYIKRLEDRMSDLSDIPYLLATLPPSSAKRAVTMDVLCDALSVVESLFSALGPLPIEETSNKLWVKKLNIRQFSPKDEDVVEFHRAATPEEEKLWVTVQSHINFLKNLYDPLNIDMKPYSTSEYQKMMRPFMDEAVEKGLKCRWNAYSDLIPSQVLNALPKDHPIRDEFKGKDGRTSLEEPK